MMQSQYKEFFRIISALSDSGVIRTQDYLADVLRSMTQEFIPEDKVFFSSNCPSGGAIMVPIKVEDPFFIVLGANYPIGESHDVLVYRVEKERVRSLIKGDHYAITKEFLLRLDPLKVIRLD